MREIEKADRVDAQAKAIMDAAQEAIILFDRDCVVRYLNQASGRNEHLPFLSRSSRRMGPAPVDTAAPGWASLFPSNWLR